MVAKALEAEKILAAKGISVSVWDMFTIKPIDINAVFRCAETGAIVTAENHNKVGGLMSSVAELLAQCCPTPLGCVAVEDCFGEVGSQSYLEQKFGLTTNAIVKTVLDVIARKTCVSAKYDQ